MKIRNMVVLISKEISFLNAFVQIFIMDSQNAEQDRSHSIPRRDGDERSFIGKKYVDRLKKPGNDVGHDEERSSTELGQPRFC